MKKTTAISYTIGILGIALATILIIGLAYALTFKAQQEAIISIVLTTGSILAPFILSIPVYYWLRRRGLGTKSEVATTLIVSIGLTISFVLNDVLLAPWLLHRVTPLGWSLSMAVAGFILTFLLSLAGSAVAKRIYQHKHSLIVD